MADSPSDDHAEGEAQPRPMRSLSGEFSAPRAEDESESSSGFRGEDFLFHLYRGSELLQDNYINEAKEELELALSMQPRDVEGQALLGVVYFRLGLYPRAIEIYEMIVKAVPGEVTPRINLSLCYLKTGQHQEARHVLEDVIRIVPDHKRAWGYLGLVFQRLGDPAKARVAFERAGQPHLARRMEHIMEEAAEAVAPPESNPPERAELRRAAADAMHELDEGEEGSMPFSIAADDPDAPPSRSGRWRAIELGQDRVPPAPRPLRTRGDGVPVLSSEVPEPMPRGPSGAVSLEQLVRAGALLPPEDAGVLLRGRRRAVVRFDVSFALRTSALRALSGPERPPVASPMYRRARGREGDEPLGGFAQPLTLLEGSGSAVVTTADERTILAVRLDDEFLYVREPSLLGFDGTMSYEVGRLLLGDDDRVPVVQLSGKGVALLEVAEPPDAVEVRAEEPVLARGHEVLGWIGRLLPRPADGDRVPRGTGPLVSFSGDGTVLLCR